MTRKYDTVEIDGVMYEKHGVKVEKKSIGSVPVRTFKDDEFVDFVDSSNKGDLELIVEDYKYGLAVRLQGMARKSVTGGSIDREAIFAKAFCNTEICTKELLMEYHGNREGLIDYFVELHKTAQAENTDEYGEDYIWDELVQ